MPCQAMPENAMASHVTPSPASSPSPDFTTRGSNAWHGTWQVSTSWAPSSGISTGNDGTCNAVHCNSSGNDESDNSELLPNCQSVMMANQQMHWACITTVEGLVSKNKPTPCQAQAKRKQSIAQQCQHHKTPLNTIRQMNRRSHVGNIPTTGKQLGEVGRKQPLP